MICTRPFTLFHPLNMWDQHMLIQFRTLIDINTERDSVMIHNMECWIACGMIIITPAVTCLE